MGKEKTCSLCKYSFFWDGVGTFECSKHEKTIDLNDSCNDFEAESGE